MMERSYGIIPLRRVEGKWECFLVKHHRGHWSFPKGHADEEETPKESAVRELFEETGLQPVSFIQEDSLEELYKFFLEGREVDKTVTYYLAEVAGELNLQSEEIADGRWFSLEAVDGQLTFDEAKKLFKQVIKLLQPR